MRRGVRTPELTKNFLDVLRVRRALPRIARGENSRRAIQRIHFQTGIVRDDIIRKMPRGFDRFQDRVRLERRAGFLSDGQFRFLRQIANDKFFTENLHKFPRLVLIAGGEEKLFHRLNESGNQESRKILVSFHGFLVSRLVLR